MSRLDGASGAADGRSLVADHPQLRKSAPIAANCLPANEVQPNRLVSTSRGHSHLSCVEGSGAAASSLLASPASQQCEQCGKTYKHLNCLSKHQWEHHWAWEATKKICATKHHQVQLLEAAQILIEMEMNRFRRH